MSRCSWQSGPQQQLQGSADSLRKETHLAGGVLALLEVPPAPAGDRLYDLRHLEPLRRVLEHLPDAPAGPQGGSVGSGTRSPSLLPALLLAGPAAAALGISASPFQCLWLTLPLPDFKRVGAQLLLGRGGRRVAHGCLLTLPSHPRLLETVIAALALPVVSRRPVLLPAKTKE